MNTASKTTGSGYTGMDGHQDNREMAANTVNSMSYRQNVAPMIKGLKTGTAANGRTKAIVEVENGSLMRYQWQWLNESGEWENIFGATASNYILSARFQSGKTYELRCAIFNPAGFVTFTDVLTATPVKVTTKALQSK